MRQKGDKRASIRGVIAIIITIIIIIIISYPFSQVLCSCVLTAAAHRGSVASSSRYGKRHHRSASS
jgi:hypothetical protein